LFLFTFLGELIVAGVSVQGVRSQESGRLRSMLFASARVQGKETA